MRELLHDIEYEMAVFAIRLARVEQIETVEHLRHGLDKAFPDATANQVERAIKHIANRLVATDIQGG